MAVTKRRIASHPPSSGAINNPSCRFIAFGSRADLLLRAKHLFVAAIVAGAAGKQDWGPGLFASLAGSVAERVCGAKFFAGARELCEGDPPGLSKWSPPMPLA